MCPFLARCLIRRTLYQQMQPSVASLDPYPLIMKLVKRMPAFPFNKSDPVQLFGIWGINPPDALANLRTRQEVGPPLINPPIALRDNPGPN